MSTRNKSDKIRSIDEALKKIINDTLQKFINETLKNSIETSIAETLNNYIDNSVNIEDPKQIIRVYYKNTVAIQENSAAVQRLYEKFEQNIEKILIEQRQKNGELKRKIQDWEQAAIDFFQLLERAIEYDRSENKQSIEKILSEFERTVINLGLERINPQQNESLNEKFHEAVTEEESNYPPGNILKCTSWGYRIGDNVIKKAKVVVAKPPTNKKQN